MNTIDKCSEGQTLSLAQRTAELGSSIKRLRQQYHQAGATTEFGSSAWAAVRARKLAHRQLSVLVPLYRTLKALSEQGKRLNPGAVARYVNQLANVLALVDSMVGWVDGEEAKEYSELLALRVPHSAPALYTPSACFSMAYRLGQQRTRLYSRQAKGRTLVTKLILSLSPAQRELIDQVHRLTGGDALRLTPAQMLSVTGESNG